MKIRPIEAQDNEAIASIIKTSLETYSLNVPGTAYFDPELGQLSTYYAERRHASYWVVENDNGDIVGGVGIAPFKDYNGICELQKLYIAPAAQGMGLAKKLMDIALEFASRHYEYCYLETTTVLQSANVLYKRYQFESLDRPLDGSDHGAMDLWYIKKVR